MSTSHPHLTRLVLTIVAAAAAAVALTGAATAHAPGAPDPSSRLYSDLFQRVLRPVELSGFYTLACPGLTGSHGRWEMREHFVAEHSPNVATSAVTRFASASDASQQLEDDLAHARGSAGFAAFSVAGIPGAIAYSTALGSTSRLTVEFVSGPYAYLLSVHVVACVGSAAKQAIRVQALATALQLYRRVQKLT